MGTAKGSSIVSVGSRALGWTAVGKELLHNLTSPQHAFCEWWTKSILIQLKQSTRRARGSRSWMMSGW